MAIVELKNVRLAFSNLWEPVNFQGEGEKKYGAVFLVPKTSPDVKKIQEAINDEAVKKWGAKAATTLAALKPVPNKYCFQDGDLKTEYDGYEGHFALTSKFKSAPKVVDKDGKTILNAVDGKPYDGCYVYGSVEIWMQDNQYGKGVRAQLRGVQFYRDGDAFAAGTAAAEGEFSDLSAEDYL